MYTPVIWVSNVWLYDTFVTKSFFDSFLLTNILVASTLVSLFSFSSFLTDVPVIVLVSLGFCGFYGLLILY